MSKKIIAVALDIKKIPYINDDEVIFTLGKQKIWYTTNIKPVNIPKHVKFCNSLFNSFLRKYLKHSDKQNIIEFNYFTRQIALRLKQTTYDEIIFENKDLQDKILPNFKNKNEYLADGTMA